MLRKDEGKENALPGRDAEPEGYWFDGPAEVLEGVAVSRRKALGIFGAGLLGATGMLTAFSAPAEARRRRRRRRRKARVNNPTPVTVVPSQPTILNITNPGNSDLTISEVKVLDAGGDVIRTINLPDVTIKPGDTANVTIPGSLIDVDARGLKLIDEKGVAIDLVDDNDDIIPIVVSVI